MTDYNDWSRAEVLDIYKQSPEAARFEAILKAHLVGQRQASATLVGLYDTLQANISNAQRPICWLFMGPTGVGKTQSAHALSQALFGRPDAFFKLDCGEIQHEHEISKVIGAPPGYLGHQTTPLLWTQKIIDKYSTPAVPWSIVLLDEIEKAHPYFYNLMLGAMDKGILHLGNNDFIDFKKTIFIMTSNLGAREMQATVRGKIGFYPEKPNPAKLDQISINAAKKRFSPEFMNRLDKVIIFEQLSQDDLAGILERELHMLNGHTKYESVRKFVFECTPTMKAFLIGAGFDLVYGARPLQRAIRRWIEAPLARLVNSGALQDGDKVRIDYNPTTGIFEFLRKPDFFILSAPILRPVVPALIPISKKPVIPPPPPKLPKKRS